MPLPDSTSILDCLIVGGGPAGLTAALYLARFRRNIVLIDEEQSRARWIPESHNIPLLPHGVSGPDLLTDMRRSAKRYGARLAVGRVESLSAKNGGFEAFCRDAEGESRVLRARRVLLATGSVDIEPDLPDLPDAVQRGLVRYCPICDGYEASDRSVAIIGHGTRGLGEALFIARTYTSDVTLLTLGSGEDMTDEDWKAAREQGIRVLTAPVRAIETRDGRIVAIELADGETHRFDILYSALGMKIRSELALRLGAVHDEAGALKVGDHNRTSVPGLYAAGDVVRGLSQIVTATGHAAVAATDIHNRCHLPTEEEPEARP